MELFGFRPVSIRVSHAVVDIEAVQEVVMLVGSTHGIAI
jgi:hypothetical protein